MEASKPCRVPVWARDRSLEALPAEESVEELFPAGAWRMLAVDDSEVGRELFRTVLEKAGYTVDTAADGAEAEAKLSASVYDLVFMDVDMPEASGPEVTRRARQRGIATTIIAVTASARAEERERCLASGMNDFLPKPFRRPDLARVLATWLPKAPTALSTAGAGEAQGASVGSGSAVLDRGAAIERFLGRTDVVERLLKGLVRDAEEKLTVLRTAVARGDAETLRDIAHAVKGAALNLSAHNLAEASRSLESCAREGPWDEAAGRLRSFEAALAELAAAVDAPPGKMPR